MVSVAASIRRQLREAGVATKAINQFWPEWWTADAESSVSATTELRYTLARRLGVSPSSLFGGPPRFVGSDNAKFKNLGTETDQDRIILTSFGLAVARAAAGGVADALDTPLPTSANQLRAAILRSSQYVNLENLISFCWAFGIPVLQITVFPLGHKRMHAMTVSLSERHTILIGRASRFRAQIAYILAHEIGHVLLQHMAGASALIEMSDPLTSRGDDGATIQSDDEEVAADRFALALLTGYERPDVIADYDEFSARQLTMAAMETGPSARIDPGVLALCLGYSTGRWRQAFGALKLLPGGDQDIQALINSAAHSQLSWESLSLDNQDYLRKVLGMSDGS